VHVLMHLLVLGAF